MTTDIEPFVAEVSLGWRRRVAVLVDDKAICWGDQRIAFQRVEQFGYRADPRTVNFTQRGMVRDIRLVADDEVVHLSLGRTAWGHDRDSGHRAYTSIVEALHARVEPRLVPRLVHQVADGGPVYVGALRVAHTGLAVARRWRAPILVPWATLPSAHFDGGHVVVTAGGATVATLSTLDFDAVLLPDVIGQLAARLA